MKNCFGKGRKHCGKRRKCWLPTVFSKELYCRHLKTRACLGKGLTLYHKTTFLTRQHFPRHSSKASFHRIVKGQECVVKVQKTKL